ncbi:uncharacterized protein LOC144436347 [Glandiceps talaboti]
MGTVTDVNLPDDMDYQLKTSDRLIVAYFTKGRNSNFDNNMYPAMARNHTSAKFLKINFNICAKCKGCCTWYNIVQKYEVTEEPTFIFIKNQAEIRGERYLDWDAPKLEAKIELLSD